VRSSRGTSALVSLAIRYWRREIATTGYVVYALLVGWYVTHTLLQVHDAQAASGERLTPVQLVPLFTFCIIAAICIALFASVAILLVRRRARRTALVFAVISCLGIPIGTIPGGLTIYALTRPEIISEFTLTA